MNIACRFGPRGEYGIRRKAKGGKIQWIRFSILENANRRLALVKIPLPTS